MKIFHTENGKEVVYVQVQDMMYLISCQDIVIPASIVNKVFKQTVIVTDSNRFEFQRFEEKDEVDFFKELYVIINYDDYKDLTDNEFKKKAQELYCRQNECAKKWNSMSGEERKKNMFLAQEYDDIEYMLNFLSEIYGVRHKNVEMPFPDFMKETKKQNTQKKSAIKNFFKNLMNM